MKSETLTAKQLQNSVMGQYLSRLEALSFAWLAGKLGPCTKEETLCILLPRMTGQKSDAMGYRRRMRQELTNAYDDIHADGTISEETDNRIMQVVSDLCADLKRALAELEEANLDFVDSHKAYERACRERDAWRHTAERLGDKLEERENP